MTYFRRIVDWLIAFAASNIVWWTGATAWPWPVKAVVGLACVAGYIFVSIRPRRQALPPVPRKIVTASAGYELLLTAGVSALANTAWWIWLGLHLGATATSAATWTLFGVSLAVGIVLTLALALGGFIQVCLGSTQVSLTTKLLVVLLWWFPPATVILLRRLMRTVAQERTDAAARAVRDAARVGQQICRTRYPILLVHGIFFRDWSVLNYWGRIPAALEVGGAALYYGGQQSSASVADSAAELATTIRGLVEQTGCGKVNIIAHSKGGLDARWAISQLGVADYVASLTTINTPHRGCNFARQLMERIPQQTVSTIGEKYDALFTKLGDPDPSFLAGVIDLTDIECTRLNGLMPDAPDVLYQSVGSRMASRFASPFPLSLGYSLIQPLEGDNDGLVAVSSMVWGDFLGLVQSSGRQGISHGDMIDLLRRDIGGFDVCEFYVNLASHLRERGL